LRTPWKRQKALTATPEAVATLRSGEWSPIPLLGGGSRQRILDAYTTAQSASYAWIYTNSPAVRTVVDVIVRNIGQLDLRLYEEKSESEREPKPEHPAALTMRYPNETTTSAGLLRALFKDFLVFDNAYALLAPAPGDQLSVSWIPAHLVEIHGSSLFAADFYRVFRPDGNWVDFLPDQMLHWHGENPHDPRGGLSRLDTLRSVIAEDSALQAAVVELAQSGLQEPVWAYRPLEAPEWSHQARAGFEEDLNNRLRRRNRMPLVLEEGMELRSFGVSPRDAQMFEVRRWALERVAAVYGVPLGMVGLRDNLKDAQSQFYSDVLPPYCEEFTRMLNQRILVRAYGWTAGAFEFNLDEKLMGDDRMRALVSATGRAVMVTNEARAKLNLKPLKGGDDLVTPMNVQVGDNPKPSVDVMPPQKPGGPPQDGSHRQGDPGVSTEPPKPPKPKALDGIAADVQGVLLRMWDRQERAHVFNGKRFTEERFARELTTDLLTLAPALDRDALRASATGIHEALDRALADSDNPREVFAAAKANAGRLATMLVTSLGMDPHALRELGVPDEVVWERAGIPVAERDRMRALQMAHELRDAT
jgi:HK97 family phage portal protein